VTRDAWLSPVSFFAGGCTREQGTQTGWDLRRAPEPRLSLVLGGAGDFAGGLPDGGGSAGMAGVRAHGLGRVAGLGQRLPEYLDAPVLAVRRRDQRPGAKAGRAGVDAAVVVVMAQGLGVAHCASCCALPGHAILILRWHRLNAC
jgi:hypothetical protein